jgi:hypothetical protein
MSERPPEQRRRRRRLGCLPRVLIAVAAVVTVGLAIGLLFDQGADAPQPQRTYNAGAAENYQPADITHEPLQQIFITRLQDGEFVVLHHQSPRQQELDGTCFITFERGASLGGQIDQLPGFTGALVEDCEGRRSVWRVDGEFAFGPAGERRLDVYSWEIDDDGDLIIRTDRRSCMQSVGVPGVPPYRERTCWR